VRGDWTYVTGFKGKDGFKYIPKSGMLGLPAVRSPVVIGVCAVALSGARFLKICAPRSGSLKRRVSCQGASSGSTVR
jgi:hypothetical protein